jgi:hypothetical protein
LVAIAASFVFIGGAAASDDTNVPRDGEDSSDALRMTPAVVCESVAGFRDYVTKDVQVVTRDDKLILYFEPTGFATEKVGRAHRVHLTEDVRLRKHGERKVLWQKDDLLTYEPKAKTPPTALYCSNTIAVKGCEPGEYDLELILHDRIAKGAPARQIVRFRVKPSPPAEPAKNADGDMPK